LDKEIAASQLLYHSYIELLRFFTQSRLGEEIQMGSRSQHLAKLITVLAASCASYCSPADGSKLIVRLHNRAEANARVLTPAQARINQVFKWAGVRLHWVDCTISKTRETPEALCSDGPGAASIKVAILPASQVNAPQLSYAAFGLTLPTGILVFSDKIRELAQTYEFSDSQVIAIVLAHELGHGLLGAGHAPSGLMAPNMKPDDIRAFSRGQVRFTDSQAERMRARLTLHYRQPADTN
jgi:hypothetical protein